MALDSPRARFCVNLFVSTILTLETNCSISQLKSLGHQSVRLPGPPMADTSSLAPQARSPPWTHLHLLIQTGPFKTALIMFLLPPAVNLSHILRAPLSPFGIIPHANRLAASSTMQELLIASRYPITGGALHADMTRESQFTISVIFLP